METTLLKSAAAIFMVSVIAALLCAGCASGDGGQVLSGILQGIGQGLSGL